MSGREIIFRPVGVIHSEHTVKENTPIQPVFAQGCRGTVEVYPEFGEGLRDLEGFSHIYLIYHFNQSGTCKLTVKPFLQDMEHGVFATRSNCRPNAIGMSIVELLYREGNILHVDGLDVLDGTPLLDLKPYAARFDRIESTRNGWQDSVEEEDAQHRGRRGYRGGK